MGKVSIAVLISVALLSGAQAETIHLKNGQTILVDSVTEKNGMVEYKIGDDSYGLPKSLVASIESGGAAPVRNQADELKEELPALAATASIPRAADVQDKLIRDGHVDQQAIDAAEGIGSPELSAAANYTAGNFEYNSGDRVRARSYFERALMFAPNSAPILDNYVATLIQLHLAQQAIPYAQQAVEAAPTSADSYYLLGRAYADSDHTAEAIAAWKQALKLRPDAATSDALAKAERESSAESNFTEADTGHFALHYEGGQTSDVLRQQIMQALESDYSQLESELGVSPREAISVSLYTRQAFFDVTQAPNWAGALYDGKLRIPVDGLTSMTPTLDRVLRHELTHSFIRDISRGRCPEWLNEGVAMSMEPRTLGNSGAQLAAIYAAQREVPLNLLEGSFTNLSTGAAQLAYGESLAATLYIRDTYGMSDVARILQRIGEGASTEAALRATIHSGYADLEGEIGDYLKKNY